MNNFQTQAAAQPTVSQRRFRFHSWSTVLYGFELPTLAVALAIYGGYAAITFFFQDMPLWIAAPLGAFWLAWYGSLQHETIHNHPTPWRRLNMWFACAPLSVWIPYRIYRSTHLWHHRHGGLYLTDVQHDPESFYVAPGAGSRRGLLRAFLYRANCTLAGRLIVGPALSVYRFWAAEARHAAAGHMHRRAIWARHCVGVALVLLWTTAVCHIPVTTYLLFVVYPGMSLSHLRSFAEHRAHPESASRTLAVEANPLWALLFLNNNLHIAHHAHPRLPWYQLPGAWQRMRVRALQAGLVLQGGYLQVVANYLWRPVISVEHPGTLADERR